MISRFEGLVHLWKYFQDSSSGVLKNRIYILMIIFRALYAVINEPNVL